MSLYPRSARDKMDGRPTGRSLAGSLTAERAPTPTTALATRGGTTGRLDFLAAAWRSFVLGCKGAYAVVFFTGGRVLPVVYTTVKYLWWSISVYASFLQLY